jgi:hypothetical protein
MGETQPTRTAGAFAAIMTRFSPRAVPPEAAVPEANAWREDDASTLSPPQPPVTLPGGWDYAMAAAVLNECEAAIQSAVTSDALTVPQRAVAGVLRGVVRFHGERRDPLLWTDRAMLEEQFARWGVRPSRDQHESRVTLNKSPEQSEGG